MRLPIPLLVFVVVGCGRAADDEVALRDAATGASSQSTSSSGATANSGRTADTASGQGFVVVTFNTGTTTGLPHGDDGDAYTEAEAALSDAWYGDGLAWKPAIEAAQAWFVTADADVVAFQEIFDVAECSSIPAAKHPGFVCEGRREGDPGVPQQVLGPAYDVICHPGRGDKCLAVHERFGAWKGPLDGAPVPDCGSGARVARGVVVRPDGSELTVVHVHGSSGLGAEDAACRVAQIDQVFVDMDGAPGVNGVAHLVLGDFNTDPGRMTALDPSAVRWNEEVGGGRPFGWITEVGEDVPPTYGGLFNIDHVVSDVMTGACSHEEVLATVYFDHLPARCTVR